MVGELTGSMQSPVNWALLGLVIERPSYAYELAQRFERTYDGRRSSLSQPLARLHRARRAEAAAG